MKYAATFTFICLCAGCVEEPPGDPKEEEATGFFSQDELKRILRASPLGMLPPDPTNAVADDPPERSHASLWSGG